MTDSDVSSDENEACTTFEPRLALTCATCGRAAALHSHALKVPYSGLLRALEGALAAAVDAIEALHSARDVAEASQDALAVAEFTPDAVDALVRTLETKYGEALDALLAPEKAQAREVEARQKRAEKRQKVLAELVKTEEEYLYDLNTLQQVWKPAVEESGLLSHHQLGQVFSGIAQLVFLSRDICQQLRAVAAKPLAEQFLGAVMLKKVPFMKLYVQQCSSVPKITETLRALGTKPQYIDLQAVCPLQQHAHTHTHKHTHKPARLAAGTAEQPCVALLVRHSEC